MKRRRMSLEEKRRAASSKITDSRPIDATEREEWVFVGAISAYPAHRGRAQELLRYTRCRMFLPEKANLALTRINIILQGDI